MTASIATRTGDDGMTSLLYGQRVPKDHPQIEAVGAFDELNVAIGAARSVIVDTSTGNLLAAVQQNLVALMGELACAESDTARFWDSKFARILPADLDRLDKALIVLEGSGIQLQGWATPGANARAVALDQARVVARRAERQLGRLPVAGRNVRPDIRKFVNRLSDVLWLLARQADARVDN